MFKLNLKNADAASWLQYISIAFYHVRYMESFVIILKQIATPVLHLLSHKRQVFLTRLQSPVSKLHFKSSVLFMLDQIGSAQMVTRNT